MRLLAGAGPSDDEGDVVQRDTAPTTVPELELAFARGSQVTLGPGQLLGDRYQIEAFIGEGGMGAVYLALDRELGEHVALKVVRGVADRATLREEVRLAQKVTHRNVCRTYDLETVGDCSFVKMEHVVGETLYMRLVRVHSLPIAETIRIARELVDGLGCAHAQGIVHRDLKPGNVMLDVHQRPVLMDFGLALQNDSGVGVLAAGTPGYMSPEQLAGTGVDARSDLYALGCLVYEMLTGERVFGQGTPLELAARHTVLAPPDPRDRRPETPRWLARAVVLLLSKTPAERVAGAALLVAGPPRPRWPLFALAALLLGAGSTLLAWPHEWTADVATLEASLPDGSSPASLSPDGTLLVYGMPGVYPDRFGYVAAVDQHCASLRAAARSGEAGPCDHRTSPQVLVAEALHAIRWTRDGRGVLYVAADRRIVRQEVARDPVRVVGAAQALGPGSEADDCGERGIVVVHDNAIVRRDAHGEHVLAVGDEHRELHGPRCDRTGARVTYWWLDPSHDDARGGDVRVVDETGVDRPLTTGHRSRYPTFTPDGTIVASTERAGRANLYEYSLFDGAARRLTFGDGPDVHPEVAADGARLVFDQDTTQDVIRRGGGDREVRVVTRAFEHVTDPVPLPGGRVLAVRDDLGTERLVVIEPGGEQRVLARGAYPISDGARALFVDATDLAVLYAVPLGGGPVRALARFPGELRLGCDAADGVHVGVAEGNDEHVRPWRLPAGGAPELEADAEGIVHPAPGGAHRVRVARARGRYSITLYAAGDDLAGPGRWNVRVDTPEVVWLDADRVAYQVQRGYDVYSIARGEVVATIPTPPGARLAPDTSWVDSEPSGQVARYLIANFGARAASR
jgi:predicted Ser/Thr protein kinase